MDYYNARCYLDAMPLPMLIVDQKSGYILFANARAKNRRFVTGGSIFLLLQNKAEFLSWAGLHAPIKSVIELRIDGMQHRVKMVICSATYKGIACLLLTVTSMEKAIMQSEIKVISHIFDIFTEPSRQQKTLEFLRVSAESVGAFCAALYEKRNKRYVMRDEWRSRKSVCVPLLRTGFEQDVSFEAARLCALKRAEDAACVPYMKPFGTQGAAVYFFDNAVGEDTRASIRKYIDLFKRLSPDMPNGNRRVMVKKGLDALDEGIVIWYASTRKLLFENRTYRSLFGYQNPRYLNSALGAGFRPDDPRMCDEDFTDNKGRYFRIKHTRSRYRGRPIVTTMMIDMTEQKQTKTQLETMAKTDALTGLKNRRAGIAHLRHVYAAGKTARRPLTVCFADIDGLKHINDTYGHGAGDSMIKAVADVLKKHVEGTGSVCRLGGDEFVLILPGMNRAQAEMLTAGIARDTAKCLVGQAEGIAMSFGYKEADYGTKETADTLINVADFEMYQEKRKKSVK